MAFMSSSKYGHVCIYLNLADVSWAHYYGHRQSLKCEGFSSEWDKVKDNKATEEEGKEGGRKEGKVSKHPI